MSFILQLDELDTPTSTMTEDELVDQIMNRAAAGVGELKQRLRQWTHEEKTGGQPGSAKQKAERYLDRYFETRKVFCERPKILQVIEDKGQKPPGIRPSDLVEVSDRSLNLDTSNEEQTGDGSIQTVSPDKYTKEKSFPKEISPDTLCSIGKETASNVSEADKKEIISQGPLKTTMRNTKLSEEAVKKSCQSCPPEVKKAQPSPSASRRDEYHASLTFSILPRKDQSHCMELGLEEEVEKAHQSQPSVSDNKYTASSFPVKAREKRKNLKDKLVPSLQKNEQTESIQLTLKEGDKLSAVTVCDISVKEEDIKLPPLKDISLGSLESPDKGHSAFFDNMAAMQVKHLKDELAKAYSPQTEAKAQTSPIRDIEITDQGVEKPDYTPSTSSQSKYPASSFASKAMKPVKHLKDKLIKVPSLQKNDQTESIQLGSEDEGAKWSPITIYDDSVKEEDIKSPPSRDIYLGPLESPKRDIKSTEKAVEKSCQSSHTHSPDEGRSALFDNMADMQVKHLKDELAKACSPQAQAKAQYSSMRDTEITDRTPSTGSHSKYTASSSASKAMKPVKHLKDKLIKVPSFQKNDQTESIQLGSEDEGAKWSPITVYDNSVKELESKLPPFRDISLGPLESPKRDIKSTEKAEDGRSALFDNMADMQVKHLKDELAKAYNPQTQAKAQYSPMMDIKITDQGVEKPDQTPSTSSQSKYPASSFASKAMKTVKRLKDKLIKVPSLQKKDQTESFQLGSEDEGAKWSPITIYDDSVKEEEIKSPSSRDISLGPLESPKKDIKSTEKAEDGPSALFDNMADMQVKHLKDELAKAYSHQTQAKAQYSPMMDIKITAQGVEKPDQTPSTSNQSKYPASSFASKAMKPVKHLKEKLIKVPSLQKNNQTESIQLGSEDKGAKWSPITIYDDSVKEEEIKSPSSRDISLGPLESPKRDIKSTEKAEDGPSALFDDMADMQVKHLKDELAKAYSHQTQAKAQYSPMRDIEITDQRVEKPDQTPSTSSQSKYPASSFASKAMKTVKRLKDKLIKVPSLQKKDQTESFQLGSEDEGAKWSPITVYDDSVKEEERKSPPFRDISLGPLESPKRDIKSTEKAEDGHSALFDNMADMQVKHLKDELAKAYNPQTQAKAQYSLMKDIEITDQAVEKPDQTTSTSSQSKYPASFFASKAMKTVTYLKDKLIKVPNLQKNQQTESIQLGSEDKGAKWSPITVYDDSVKEEEIKSLFPRDKSLSTLESPNRDIKTAKNAAEKSCWASDPASLDEFKHLKDKFIKVPSLQTYEQTESLQLGSEDGGAKLSPITVYDDSVKEEEIKSLSSKDISLGPLESPKRYIKSTEKAVEKSCRSSHPASLVEVKHLKDELIKVPSLQKHEQTESVQLDSEDEGAKLSPITVYDDSVKELESKLPPFRDISFDPLESPKSDIKSIEKAEEGRSALFDNMADMQVKHLKDELAKAYSHQTQAKAQYSPIRDIESTDQAVEKPDQTPSTSSQSKHPASFFASKAMKTVKHLKDKLIKVPNLQKNDQTESLQLGSEEEGAQLSTITLYDNLVKEKEIKPLPPRDIFLGTLESPKRYIKSTEKTVEKSCQSSYSASFDEVEHLQDELIKVPSLQTYEQTESVQLGSGDEGAKLSPITVYDFSVKEEEIKSLSPRDISLSPLESPNRHIKSAEKAVEKSCQSSHPASLDKVKRLKDELIKVPSLQKNEQTESIQLRFEKEGDELSPVTVCDNSVKEEIIQSPPSQDISLGSLESPKRDIKRTKEAVKKSLQSSHTASSDEMKHLKNELTHRQAKVKCSHSRVKWTCTEKVVKKSHQSSHFASPDKGPSALFDNTADMQVKHLTDERAKGPSPHGRSKVKCSHSGVQWRSRHNSAEKFRQSSHTASPVRGPSDLFDNTADMQVKHLMDELAKVPRLQKWAKVKCSHSGLQWRSTEKAVEKSHQSSHTASADKGPSALFNNTADMQVKQLKDELVKVPGLQKQAKIPILMRDIKITEQAIKKTQHSPPTSTDNDCSAPPFAGKAKKKCKHLMNEHEKFPSPQKKEQIRSVQLGLEKEADKLSPVSVDDNSVKEEEGQKISWWRRLFRFKMNKVYPAGQPTSNKTSKKKSLCSWLFKRHHKIYPSPETSPPSNNSPKRFGKMLQMLFCCASTESQK